MMETIYLQARQLWFLQIKQEKKQLCSFKKALFSIKLDNLAFK